MNQKIIVTPGGLTKTSARISALVTALFFVFGATFGYVMLQESQGDDPGQRLLTVMFFAIWLVLCGAMFFFFLRVGFGKGKAQMDSLVDLQISDTDGGTKEEPPSSPRQGN